MSKIKNNKILNILILGIFSLLILGLSITVALLPYKASAETPGTYRPYSNNFVDTSNDSDDDYDADDFDNPKPKLYYVDPNTASTQNESMRITVSGANFTPQSVVRFDGSTRSTRFDGSSKLTAVLTSRDMSDAGVHTITVFTPNGGTSNKEYLTLERRSTSSSTNSGTVLGASANRNSGGSYTTTPADSDSPIVYNDYRGQFGDLTANALYGDGSFLPQGILQWILVAILILIIVILIRKFFGHENHYHGTPLKHS